MYLTVIAVANLGTKPELRYTPSGQPVCNFSAACNHQYVTGNGEKVKETTWLRVSVFGKQAEACNQYLDKGSRVLIEGRLAPDKSTGGPRIWNKQDGSPSASYDVTAGTVRFLSSREAGPVETAHELGGTDYHSDESDLPF